MEGHRKICLIVLCLSAINSATSTIKESLHIPEKIIGGVIDIVQSHKNKPTGQAPPNYQYPPYQQWNGQSAYQSQGGQSQPQYQGQQYQNQGQYANYPQGGNGNFPQGGNNNLPQGGNNNFPQNGNNNFPHSGNNGYPQNGNANYPTGGSNFPQNGNNFPQNGNNFGNNQGYPTGSGQSFSQGQYQGGSSNHIGQPNNQYPNTQSGYYTQSQPNGQYQGTNTGPGQYTGQPGFGGQGNASGQTGQGFYGNNGSQAGQGTPGPTCVCQAWTKPPTEIYSDTPVTDKSEKKEDTPKERMF